MNKALMAARQKFRKQRGKIKQGYDNSNVPEGNYVTKVRQSEVKTITRSSEECIVHALRLSIELGDSKGRSLFPFAPRLDDQDGILQAAKNLRTILGDVIPGKLDKTTNEFEVDYDGFLKDVEDLTNSCLGELVEVMVRNGKTNKDDGTPWQNVYINRGLGEDANSVIAQKDKAVKKTVDDPDNLSYGKEAKKTTRKKAKKRR